MCGIAGQFFFNNQKPDEKNIRNAVELLIHRGPDNKNILINDNCALGHTRLSIIDLSSNANQPFVDETGRYVIIFNGEIYNYQELKSKLSYKGINFKTSSDTEVLLYHLIINGSKGINDLNGFFAFAFYDKYEESLLVARDRFGIKPLYFFNSTVQFAFASELKVLFELEVPRKLNKEALPNYFRFNYFPGSDTAISDVYKLNPGHCIVVNRSSVDLYEYYQPKEEFNSENLYKLLEDSVQKRLVADIEVGSFLSGGVDSSIIAALAKKSKPDLRTFSVGFEKSSLFDESSFAEQVAGYLKTNHQTIGINSGELVNVARNISTKLDEPFADSSALAVYALSSHVKNYVSVALSGDGADELFGGYNKHLALCKSMQKRNLSNKLIRSSVIPFKGGRNSYFGNKIRQIRKYKKGLKLNPADRYNLWSSFCEDFWIEKLVGTKSHLPKQISEMWTGRFEDFLLMDQLMVLPNDMLKKVDSMSMMTSLEVRVPFLDHRVVEKARSLHVNELIYGGKGKQILRSTFDNLLPQSVFERSKHGFEVPLKEWIDNELRKEIDYTLSPNEINKAGVLNPDTVNQILKISRSSQPGDLPYTVWAIFVLQNWINENL